MNYSVCHMCSFNNQDFATSPSSVCYSDKVAKCTEVSSIQRVSSHIFPRDWNRGEIYYKVTCL